MNDIAVQQKSSLEESLSEVLARLVCELHDVARLIERMEPQVLDLAGDRMLQSMESMKVMQGIDLAVQKARGLADFVDSITAAIPPDCMVDLSTALNVLKLTDMKKALGAGVSFERSPPLSKAAGDFDFF